jgi:hypothetical protein
MGTIGHVLWIALLMCLPARLAGAEPDADPSGHWEGAVRAPGKPVTIEVDLARNARGELIGTLGNPSEGEKGLPLATVVVAGREVHFAVNARSGGGSFRATLRDDGQAMSGDFTLAKGSEGGEGMAMPFQLTRTGAPRIARPPRSPPISKRLAGRWTGTLTVDGKSLTLGLVLANQPDGRASGTIRSDGLELPVAIAETAAEIRIDVPSVTGSYVGAWDAAGQLVGTWSQRSKSLPLTFRRETK